MCAVFAMGGCSSVEIHKIDPATGLIVPNSPEGVHYYMPRPYVSVAV